MANGTEPDNPLPSEDDSFEAKVMKWQKSKVGRIVESGYLALVGSYCVYKFRAVENVKAYKQLAVPQKLRTKSVLFLGAIVTFYLSIHRALEIGIYHPTKTVRAQLEEEWDWFKSQKENLFSTQNSDEEGKS